MPRTGSCQKVLQLNSGQLGPYGENAHLVEPFYQSMVREQQAVQSYNGFSGVLVHTSYYHTDGIYQTLRSHFEKKPSLTSRSSGRALVIRDWVAEFFGFVASVYRDRLTWSDEVHDELFREALLYFDQTIFWEVKKETFNGVNQSETIGAIKIVEASQRLPLHKLPLDGVLKDQVPSNGGRKFEIGNYAVLRSENHKVTAELVAQLVLHAREQMMESNHEADQPLYYALVDKKGRRLYSLLGFSLVPGFEDPIIDQGETWWLLAATAESLAHLPARLQMAQQKWEEDDRTQMEELLSRLMQLTGSKVEVTGQITRSIDSTHPKVEGLGYYVSEPFSFGGRDFVRLSIHTLGTDLIEVNVRIPLETLPFKSDWTLAPNPNLDLTYRDSALTIKDRLFDFTLTLAVDANLESPKSVSFKGRRHQLEAWF